NMAAPLPNVMGPDIPSNASVVPDGPSETLAKPGVTLGLCEPVPSGASAAVSIVPVPKATTLEPTWLNETMTSGRAGPTMKNSSTQPLRVRFFKMDRSILDLLKKINLPG